MGAEGVGIGGWCVGVDGAGIGGGLEEEVCAADRDREREGGRGMVADRVAGADTNRVVAVAEAW